MKILIGADIVPTPSNVQMFESANVEELVDPELLKTLSDANFRVFNLEIPLSDVASPIEKSGPCLIAPQKSAYGLRALGIDFCTLANNHILDQDVQGLKSTEDALDRVGIRYAGVGKNAEEASKPFIFENHGIKVGIYCCAEHEFSIAGETSPGANPFDPIESLDHIKDLSDSVEYTIVLYHGGKEHYRYPSPYLQKVCRKIVEKGADLVICQHSHCIGCEEDWKSGKIVYGQGNFLFDRANHECWNTGLLVEVELGEEQRIAYIPVVKEGASVKLASDDEAKNIMDAFYGRSKEIKNPIEVKKKYDTFCKEFDDYLLMQIYNIPYRSLLFRAMNKLSGGAYGRYVLRRKSSTTQRLLMLNYLECEAWRELIANKIKM